MPKPTAPRRSLNRAFIAAVRASAMPIWMLARRAGFAQHGQLSWSLHAAVVVASPLNTQRFHLLADVIDFPREQVFLDEIAHVEEAARA